MNQEELAQAPPLQTEDEAQQQAPETGPLQSGGAEAQPADESIEDEATKYKDLYLRSVAEMDNMRRRFQKEKEEQARYAAGSIIKGLLPVLDNLGLALHYITDDASAETKALAEGVRMTLKGCLDVLADNGLKPIEAERGCCFDPNFHEALGQAPDPDLAPGHIVQEVQKGYLLYQRLIRPAKVLVSMAPPSEGQN